MTPILICSLWLSILSTSLAIPVLSSTPKAPIFPAKTTVAQVAPTMPSPTQVTPAIRVTVVTSAPPTSAAIIQGRTFSSNVTVLNSAVSSKATSSSSAMSSQKASSTSATTSSPAATGSPTTFTGDGSAADGWPTIDKWADYATILANNQKILSSSCAQFNASNNTPAEISSIDTSVQSIAKTTNVDPRFILAVIMQESKGCVRVPATISPDGTVRNPGLMQDHNGANSCANVSVPCPPATITGMISDGTNGTVGLSGGGDGLKQTLAQATGTDGLSDAQAVYVAARIYNSGSYTVGTDLGTGAATASYSSDIANRLLGLAF